MRVVLLLLALIVPISAGANGEEPEIVSLLNLLVAPKQFDGHRVRVIGFLAFEPESAMLYLHREDYEHNLVKNGIALRGGKDCNRLNLVYVMLDGTFEASAEPNKDVYTGFLRGISGCHAWHPAAPKSAS